MEGNISSRNIMQHNTSYGGFDLQVPVRIHHHNSNNPRSNLSPTIHENFPLTNQETHTHPLTADFNKPERIKSTSDDDEPSFNNEDPNKGKRPSSSSSPCQWHRVKWTDSMVRLLITAVSYITEETASESVIGVKRKYSSLQKKGKWKSVSKVMAERGHLVSPQQCEDKFNDLNKRYKRLNEILGRGTSCEVVENPVILDLMDHIPEKAKDEVRKILSSKHLHYEEMCSYHNGNRLHLPPDPELHRSLRLALRNREDHDDNNHENDVKRHPDEENDEIDEQEVGGFEDHKVVKPCPSHEDFFSFDNSFDHNAGFNFRDGETNVVLRENATCRLSFQLEEQRLHLEARMLELEKEKFKWQRFCRKKDRELEMTRMEIERMKLENERMALELRRKEMGIDDN